MIQKLLVLALALAALVPSVHAQSDWNRRISDIRIVHPPGTPPGTYRATVETSIYSSPNAPVPTNLSMDLVATLDGMPFTSITIGAETASATIPCFGATCPDTGCNFWNVDISGTVIQRISYCLNAGPLYGCTCWLESTGPWHWDFVAPPGTVVGVTLTPSATAIGALPEVDTSDDTLSVRISDQIPGTDFCFGDGSGSACPCGNNGAPGNGCASSVNPLGAYLGTSGTASVANDTVVLDAQGMPNSSCLYFQGTTMLAGNPFGDGLRCAGGSLIRLRTKINVGGRSRFPEAGDPPVSVAGGVPASGGLRTYQAWYRNAAAFCTPATFNLTNGTRIDWVP